jgi:hypothetical protein
LTLWVPIPPTFPEHFFSFWSDGDMTRLKKKLTLTKLANYRNFAFKDFTVATGRNKKIFRSQHGFLFPLIMSPFIYTGALIFDPNHDMCKEPQGYQIWN